MIDLGKWASEEYRIPGSKNYDQEEGGREDSDGHSSENS
jgi:endogenous inhibitor of DNA gyrase (YacG/DUF329 family)